MKDNNDFFARYQISLEIWNKNNLTAGKILTREFTAKTYEETTLQNKLHLDSLIVNFAVTGRFNTKLMAKLQINDLNSTNQGSSQFDFVIPNIISKMRFYTNNIPNPQHIYSTDPGSSETLGVILEIYTDSVENCSLWITKEYDIKNLSKSERSQVKKQSDLLAQFFPIENNIENAKSLYYTFNFSYQLNQLTNLVSGQYRLTVAGYNLYGKKIFETSDSFSISNSFFYSDAEYFEMVNKLMYIASASDIKNLKVVLPAKRDSAWHAFWEKHDPTPTTAINESEQEYFLRIDYCIKNFSKGDKGYKSDRAKVYMKYGQPDFIESRPFERFSNAYEIWYYYNISKKYVFLDLHGFGEFILNEEKGL